jgi:NADPH-dependent glutamate synthase beta subunit-like oxidoreductase/CO/xanthine dehydrogenase FAD-binding subunit
MREFIHINAATVEEAASSLKKHSGKAKVIAGGTDLLGQMKDEILPDYPEVIVNLKSIQDLDYIREEGGTLKIGPLTRLEDIAENKTVRKKYTALAGAAGRVASPHIREMGTIAGNICQGVRCWYYRNPNNRFYCARKGGKLCNAITGDNRYHSIFGAMRVGSPPCSSNCPTGVNIPSYLEQIRDGNLPEAAKVLLESNPIPAMTGRVCPHNCEQNCNRGEFDEAVSVRAIERFMGDYILDNAAKIITPPKTDTGKSVAIVGSGPSGLSAAYCLRKLGYRVTVYDRMEKPGGLLAYGIPEYRLPKAIVEKQINAIKSMGVEFKLKVNISKDMSTENLMKSADAVFLACGAWKEREIGIKGEELAKSGLEFLKSVNLGVKKVPGKEVAVIGGGNVAMDVARTLLRMGAKPVVVYRRSEAEMPAVKEEIEKAKEDGVKFEFLTLPTEASAKGNKIALKCVRMKLGPADESGRPRPIQIEGSEFTSEFDAVMKSTGEMADTAHVPARFLGDKGRIKIDSSKHFLGQNLFAGGDFVTGPSTVVEAIAEGRKAAESIAQFLGGLAKEKKEGAKLPQKFNSSYLKKTSRAQVPELPVSERLKILEVEDVLGLGSDKMEEEANRCFNCGCLAVNPSDVAPALIALNAKIKTTKRTIAAEQFFTVEGERTTVLDDAEIVTEIQIPAPSAGTESKFIKFALRKSIDFPLVNCASAIESKGGVVTKARICLNAVYNQPYRVKEAEEFLIGKKIGEPTAEASGKLAVAGACPLAKNTYMIQIAKTLVKRTILACA